MELSFVVINMVCHIRGSRRFVVNIRMYVENKTGHGENFMMGSLFSSSVPIRIIKSRRVGWVSHVACM
jgi:hypothetical protein